LKRVFPSLLLAGSSLFLTSPAQAQYLDSYLDAQRWGNLREHQQDQRSRTTEQQQRTSPDGTRSVSASERQAAWSRNKAEYRQRLVRDGKSNADRWLDQMARAGR